MLAGLGFVALVVPIVLLRTTNCVNQCIEYPTGGVCIDLCETALGVMTPGQAWLWKLSAWGASACVLVAFGLLRARMRRSSRQA